MKRPTSQRSEEARREAQSAMLRAKQEQSRLMKERAAALAVQTQKVGNLRALRLAREAEIKNAEDAVSNLSQKAKPIASKRSSSKRKAEGRAADLAIVGENESLNAKE